MIVKYESTIRCSHVHSYVRRKKHLFLNSEVRKKTEFSKVNEMGIFLWYYLRAIKGDPANHNVSAPASILVFLALKLETKKQS